MSDPDARSDQPGEDAGGGLGEGEALVEWLARYDDALLRGETPPDLEGVDPDDLPVDVDRFRAMLELLDHALRPGSVAEPPNDLDTPAFPSGPEQVARHSNIGRFQVERELGRGGFGIVLLALDPETDRRVALKIPRSEAFLEPETRRRFLREARNAARLDHPNLIPVFEAGEAGPTCYITSAYCEGPTLRDWIDAGNAPIDPQRAARLALAMTSAIVHMHARGILHCDLKPGNVLLDFPGDPAQDHDPVPRITDFGLSRLAEGPSGESTGLRPWGTPPYMAPELVELDREAIGPPTDVYAIGAILCELLSGRPPHAAATIWDLVHVVLSEPPLSPRRVRPSVPKDLDAIVLKCLEKKADRRYASALELADDLQRVLDRRPTRARPLGRLQRSARWAVRRPTAAGLVALGVLTLLLSLGASVVLLRMVHDLEEANLATNRALEGERAQSRVATIALADQELRRGRYAQAQRWLRELIPAPGEPDRRDFAWHYLWRQSRRDRTVLDELSRDHGVFVTAGPGVVLGMMGGFGEGGLWRIEQPDGFDGPRLGPIRPVFRFERPSVLAGNTRFGTTLPDGRLAVGHVELPGFKGLAFFEPDDGGTIQATLAHSGLIGAGPFAFHPDGVTLAFGHDPPISATKRITRQTLEVGDRQVTLLRIPSIMSVAFSPDGTRLAAAHLIDGTRDEYNLELWDTSTGLCLIEFTDDRIGNGIAFSPRSGGPIATTTPDGAVQLREPIGGQVIQTIPVPDLPGRSRLENLPLAFSPDGDLLAIGYDRYAILQDLRSGQVAREFEGLTSKVRSIAFLPGLPSEIALGLNSGEVVIWHAEPIDEAIILEAHDHEVWGVAFDPSGTTLATLGGDRLLKLWDATTGQFQGSMTGHQDWPSALVSSPTGRELVSADFDGRLFVWDPAEGRLVREFPAHADRIRGLAFSPDGSRLATGGRDRLVRLWETTTWQCLGEYPGHEWDVRGLAFSPDGQSLASVSEDATIILRDPESGRERARWQATVGSTRVAFSPDGRTLASGEIQGAVVLWDVATGAVRARLAGLHSSEISGLSFSPDGLVLAVGGFDGIISLVEVSTGRVYLALTGHDGGVNALAFSPDGRTLASASHDRTVRLWCAGPDSLVP